MDKLCYYLHHGLWSVVEGLLHEDEPVDPQDKSFPELLLCDAAANPLDKCFSSQIVEFPWHQSWMSAILIQKIKSSAMDGNVTVNEIEAIKKEAEFQCILFSLPRASSYFNVLEELMHLYGQVVRADRVKSPVHCLSVEARNFLSESMIVDTVTTNTVIQNLLCMWCSHFTKIDDELQYIYTRALEMCILQLENRNSAMSINKCDNPTEDLSNTLLCILSLIDVSENIEKEITECFFPRLLKLCELGLISRQLLYLSIVSRRKLKLTKQLIYQEDNKYERGRIVNEIEVIEKICAKLFDSLGNVQIEEMFLRLVKKEKHWIEDFVDISSHLLVCGNIEVVQKFLSHHTMSKLWPLVLLHIWQRFSDKNEIFTILSFLLEQCKKVVNDPVFSSLCFVVEHQILVVQWCKKHGKRFSFNNKEFLELTKEHSTLEVLRRTTSLDDLELKEARHLLLLKMPDILSEEVVKDKTRNWEVTTFDGFCILRKAFTLFQASLEIEQLNFAVDIANCHLAIIVHGHPLSQNSGVSDCGFKSAGILTGKKMYKYNSHSSKSDVLLSSVIAAIPAYFFRNYPSVIHRHPSLETEDGCSNPVIVETLYRDKVTKQLQDIKAMLCQLFPLNFRVEILENIFSLLFLRYEDFQEETSSDSGADDDDDDGDHNSRGPEPKILSKLVDNTNAQPLEEIKRCEVTHNMTSFQPTSDVSSLLRTIPLIEAHISGSPPLECSGLFSAQCQSPPDKEPDTSLITSSPVQIMDMSTVSKYSDESHVTSSEKLSHDTVSISSTFNKFSSLPTGFVMTSSPSPKPNSAPNLYSTEKFTEQCFQSAGDVTTDVPKLQTTGKLCHHVKQKERKRSTKSNYSENASTRSGTSNVTVKGTQQGFVCNQYLVRDLLHCLKECLVETSAAFYSTLSMDAEELRKTTVLSSIQPGSLQQRMNRLSVCVSEATWRLQLNTDAEFIQHIGQISVLEHVLSIAETQSDWLYFSAESESEDENEIGASATSGNSVISGRAQKTSYKRSKSEMEKSSESGSQSNKSTGGAIASSSSYHKVRRSKSQLRYSSCLLLPNGIINLMLSSQNSLAVRCLTHGELDKAKQVIKMFEVEDNPLAVEVKFIEAYHSLLCKLKCCVENSPIDAQVMTSTPSGRKTSTLESIKKAASAGIHSTSLTSQVETFLSITPIPGIQGAEQIVAEFPHEAIILQGVENNAGMTALDLALTIGATYEHSASLLDLACKRCDILQRGTGFSETSSTRSRTRNVVSGYIQFIRNVIKLLKEANKSQSSSIIFPSNISLSDLISTEYLPLSLRTLKECVAFWNSLHEATAEFEVTLKHTDGMRVSSGSSKQLPTNPGGSFRTGDEHTVKSHVSFRKLLEISKGHPVHVKNSGSYVHYLQQVYVYLKLVTSLLHQNFPSETEHLGEISRPAKYFDLFNSSLLVLLGRLVFECDISPTYLEPIAVQLKLNLVYNIVCNCCPKIPNSFPSRVSSIRNGQETNWGRIILNGIRQWDGEVRHPEVAVRSLLADLVHMIQQQSEQFTDINKNVLNCQHVCALAENPSVKVVLTETCELSAIDLDCLVSGDETLVFYTNLANLMWIHSLLVLETNSLSTSDQSVLLESMKNFGVVCSSVSDQCWTTKFGLFSSYLLEKQIVQMSVGYNVGKLGFISFQEVHHYLLGELAFSSASSLKTFPVLGKVSTERTLMMDSTSVDPRVLFVLQNGQRQSPKMQVLIVERVDSQLDNSMMDFLNHNVKLDDKSQQLIIPELLHLYLDYVQLNQEPESHNAVPNFTSIKSPHHFSLEEDDDQISTFYSRERLTQLLDFLRDNTSGQLQSEIIKFASSVSDSQLETAGTIVRIEKSTNEFGILLDYSDFEDDIETSISVIKSKESCDLSEDAWKHRVVQDHVLKFLDRHCWLLSVLVQKVHQEKSLHASPVTETLSHKMTDQRTKCLEQLFRSEWINVLKPVFQNNLIVAALHSEPSVGELWCFLDTLVKKQEWYQCAETLWALPENELLNDPKLQRFYDVVMYEQASKLPHKGCPSPWWYCQHIRDVCIQAQCLLKNLPQWPGYGCQEALKTVLGDHQQKLPAEVKSHLQQMLHNISIYEKILPFTDSANMKTWYDVSCASEKNPSLILDLLMEAKEFQICRKWAEMHNISTRAQHLVDSKFVLLFLEDESSDFSAATKLLQSLPIQQSIVICNELIWQLRSISCLKFITSFLLNSCSSNLSSKQVHEYQHLYIGIQMLTVLPCLEQFHHWDLIGQPHLIVEQFIMNTRLEMLEKMVSEVHPLLVQLPANSPMSGSSIDFMLRHYASKALDFRVIQNATSCRTFLTEEKLLVSLSLGSAQSEEFIMPVVVPSKNDWVQNDEVTECMCCQSVAFSMFNRRHHCRRCGRVICGSCSTQRTKVMGYGSVEVRVCDDCHQQMMNDAEQMSNPLSDENQPPFSDASVSPDFSWKLTLDDTHNTTLREEFGFEHAPSVSLCLAILKLHSEHVAYPGFLLDACDRMLRLLQPVGPGTANPEVDYHLVIRMVRSLVVAAKVKHARSGLNTGVAHCDQLLSQVDLLNMLVKSGCSALIPAETLNGHALRRLRDRLVEEELWMLAMEVSTKSGLERTGVWAAWGKACLRAGCWDEAHEKFSHCLEKVQPGPDSARPPRNPPLINEIIQILEEGAYTVDRKVLQQADKIRSSRDVPIALLSSPALTVLHTLSSLKEIADGNYPQTIPPLNTVIIGPKLDPLFYKECRYYLSLYGSHAGIINFYLGHDDLMAALKHVLSQKVDPDIFFEVIYIPCLRQGLVSNLYQELSTIDPTLEVWKLYLCHVCHHLEKQGLLNVLYQLQLHMHDYIRAAMTCIRFYGKRARNYTDLASNLDHLHSAHGHLENELLTVQWGTRSRLSPARKMDSTLQLAMKLDPREVNRHISTILRQVEVTKFLHGCELERRPVMELLPELLESMQSIGIPGTKTLQLSLPTLFGSTIERVQLAVLTILCGKNIEEGFGIAFRIIEDYHLKASQVYSLAGKKLAQNCSIADIEQLISCIQSSGMSGINTICDSVLVLCMQVLAEKQDPGDVEQLVKLIADVGNRITAYLECRQLKSAYLLAVKYNRVEDVRKILHEAEKLGQTKIQQICLKRLSQQAET